MRELADGAAVVTFDHEGFDPDLRFTGTRTGPAANDSSYFESFIQELLGSVPA